tara:strand:+ start:235 stop:381 length:147 start_codon:yes stop_codon:yes gene_type:complete
MSRNSAKQRIDQLKEWMKSNKVEARVKATGGKFSKADAYKDTNRGRRN